MDIADEMDGLTATRHVFARNGRSQRPQLLR